MNEAMACGTPPIAVRCGAATAITTERGNCFIVDDLQTAIECVAPIPEIERRTCRAVFEQHFTVERMTSDYLALYRRILAEMNEPDLLAYEPTPPVILQ